MAGTVVFVAGFAVFCFLEIRGVVEAERWTERTNDVLDGIADAELSMHLADYAGWIALLNPEAGTQIKPFRDTALEHLDRLIKRDDTELPQRQNFERIRTALVTRFAAQDLQRESLRRSGNTLTFEVPVVEKAINSSQTVDRAFAETRFDERALLLNRTEIRNANHRRLLSGLIICALLASICTLALAVRMIKELKLRREVGKLITKRKPGELPPWMQEIHQIIEGADKERANIKHWLMLFL
jgi:hypothetical protein